MKIPPLRLLTANLLLASSLAAQTWVGGTSTSWDDAANWNTGAVPDGAAATATFTAAGLDPQFNTDIAMTADRTLAGIVFASDARPVTLYAGQDSVPSNFALVGAGLQNSSSIQQRLWLTSPAFNLTNEISLTFRNQATVTGDVRLIAIGENRHLVFRDQTSAGSASIGSYNTDFYDQSSAGHASFDQTMGGIVTFHDHSAAATAKLPGYYGLVTFADFSSAGSASILRPELYGASVQVVFRDESTAASATLHVYDVDFSGRASAGHALLSNAGSQVYSSHGAYATQFATTTFRDQSRAGDAVIGVNSLASLAFTDNSSAERAIITNTGRVTFSGHATFADAHLNAGSGTYYVNTGYNQPAILTPIGDVVFKDQATGGGGGIELNSDAAQLDFSGLFSGTGTTGRALLPANPSAPAVTPDDAPVFALGALTNTVPGGTIYLGGTQLQLGSANSAMVLNALVRDTGGTYGSGAGAPLRSGGLVKVGTGTLTIANPNNDYSGLTTVAQGTLNLAGGRINDGYITAQGRLTGTGVVRGQLVNAALVSPGNSAGTINVTGNYSQDALGTLQIELVAPDTYHRLVVGGTATLGGTLQLSLPAGFVPVGNTTFNFLTAGSINGTFATVTQGPGLGAALSSQLAYGAGGVSLQVTQHPFAGFGGSSPAGVALGGHLDATLAGATGDYRGLITGLNTLSSSAAIATALGALAPDRYAALADNSLLGAAALQAAQDRRLAAMRASTLRGFTAFFEAGQRRASFDAAPGLPAAQSSLGAGTAGGAWRNAGFTLGAAVTREDGDLDLDTTGSRAKLQSTVPAVFFQYAGDLGFVSATAAFGHDNYDLRRHVTYPGLDRTATAAASGSRHDLAVTLGRDFNLATWSITPQAGVLASRWQIDRFTETGAAGANLTILDQSIRSLRTRAGFDVTGRSARFVPRLSVFWLHETGDDRALRAAFAGAAGSPYTAPGRTPDTNLVQASLAADLRVGRHAVLNVALGGVLGRNSVVTSDLSAGLRWEF